MTLYANGSGGLIERMGKTGADVIGLDWTIDMADARRRLGADKSVQVSSRLTYTSSQSFCVESKGMLPAPSYMADARWRLCVEKIRPGEASSSSLARQRTAQ